MVYFCPFSDKISETALTWNLSPFNKIFLKASFTHVSLKSQASLFFRWQDDSPLDNYPRTIPLQIITPWTIVLWTITPPKTIVPRTTTRWTIPTHDNFPYTILLGQLPTRTIASLKLPRGQLPPKISHKNYWDSLYFHEKVLKKFASLKDTQKTPPSWFNVVSSLEKLFQGMVVRNEQASLQPTFNNRAGGVSLTAFVTDYRTIALEK